MLVMESECFSSLGLVKQWRSFQFRSI